MDTNLFVVIPTHNDVKRLVALLSQITQNATVKKVVVVDNGSTDGTIERIKSAYRSVYLIENKANVGFVKAANVGISFALANRASHVLLLTPSFIPESPEFLDYLLSRKGSIIAPAVKMTRNGNDKYRVGVTVGNFIALPHSIWQSQKPPRSFNSTPQAVLCDCTLIEQNVFGRIGLFDEAYASYYADLVFCQKAKAAGFKIAIAPQAVATVTPYRHSTIGRRQMANIFWHDFRWYTKQFGSQLQQQFSLLMPLFRAVMTPSLLR